MWKLKFMYSNVQRLHFHTECGCKLGGKALTLEQIEQTGDALSQQQKKDENEKREKQKESTRVNQKEDKQIDR